VLKIPHKLLKIKKINESLYNSSKFAKVLKEAAAFSAIAAVFTIILYAPV
jgi:hypothetical protein